MWFYEVKSSHRGSHQARNTHKTAIFPINQTDQLTQRADFFDSRTLPQLKLRPEDLQT